MSFDKWLYEEENFSLRLERLHDEVPTENNGALIRWLKAAYEEGYNQSRYDTMKLYWDDGK